jgi:hypothetical protein
MKHVRSLSNPMPALMRTAAGFGDGAITLLPCCGACLTGSSPLRGSAKPSLFVLHGTTFSAIMLFP